MCIHVSLSGNKTTVQYFLAEITSDAITWCSYFLFLLFYLKFEAYESNQTKSMFTTKLAANHVLKAVSTALNRYCDCTLLLYALKICFKFYLRGHIKKHTSAQLNQAKPNQTKLNQNISTQRKIRRRCCCYITAQFTHTCTP